MQQSIFTLGIFITFLLSMGCSSLEKLLSDVPKPSARVVDVNMKDLGLETATLVFTVEVSNPYKVALPPRGISYELASKQEKFLEGDVEAEADIPAQGKQNIDVPAKITFLELLKTVNGISAGDVIPYNANIGIAVDPPALEEQTLRLNKQGEIPVPTAPEVSVSNISWSELSFSKASAILSLDVKNNNNFPIEMENMDYNLKLGGVSVAQDQVKEKVSLNKGKTDTIKIPFSMSPKNLGLSVFTMLTGQELKYQMDGKMNFQTPYTPIEVPFSSSGRSPSEKK